MAVVRLRITVKTLLLHPAAPVILAVDKLKNMSRVELKPETGPTKSVRILLAIFATGLTAGFALAVSLDPDPRGFGTHQQLGLPACQFRQYLNVSCPHCGMTTGFAHIVRGQLGAAWDSNPAALPLAVLCAAFIPWFGLMAIRGRWLLTDEPFRWILNAAIGYVSLAVLIWLLRIAF